MEYGKLEQELIDLCLTYPPDFDAIRGKIAEGADVNAGATDSNIISEILYNYGWDWEGGTPNIGYSGEYLPRIVQILLDAGFEVSHCGGAYGGDALWNLVFAPPCRACFEVAEILLKAGANPRYIPPDDYEDVLEAVRFHGALAMDDSLTWGSGQEDLTEGEFAYRLYLFLRDWPMTTIDKCLGNWPKMKFEEWKHTWPLDLAEYLLTESTEDKK